MVGLRDIKRRLTSVKNTRKITYAMKLVSAAKLKRAQDAVTRSREYTRGLNRIIADLTAELNGTDISHPLSEVRPAVQNIGLVVVGGGRGLCGGYNTNVNRRVEQFYRTMKSQNPSATIKAFVIGKKPTEYFKRTGKKMEVFYDTLSEEPKTWPLAEVTENVEQQFIEGNLDQVYMIYTHFKSAMTMTVEADQILPIAQAAKDVNAANFQVRNTVSGGMLVEPSVEEALKAAIARIFRIKLLQASLDSKASEHASRMTAMDAATKNAGDLIKRLQLTYNKLRQAGITGELLDIIGGAEAVN